MPHTDEDFMRQALALARQAYDRGEAPVGAVVVREGAVIGRGQPARSKPGPLAHAEIVAIAEAAKASRWRLDDATYVTRTVPCVRGCDRERADPARGVWRK